MKVCFFSKYPPIEGGVSARTYWLARALGKKGLEIHLITNALEVEENYKEKIDWENLDDILAYQPDNVFIHSLNLQQKIFHIPYSPAYLERLLNEALGVVEKYRCDLIDSWYILPYGLAGFFSKIITRKPFILRYAGSDITRLYRQPGLKDLFYLALKGADRIVTNQGMVNFFEGQGIDSQKLFFLSPSSPDPEFFNPKIASFDLNKLGLDISKKTPLLTYIGKYSRNFKGLFELADTLNKISQDFFLLLLTGGENIGEFESYLKKLKGLKGKYKIIGFLPPWHIPGIIKASSCLVQLETDFPIKIHWPQQPQEAMACAKPCLLSRELYEKFKDNLKLKDKENILSVNPKEKSRLKEVLEFVIDNPNKLEKIGRNSYNLFNWQKRFDDYIDSNIELYEKVSRETGNVYLDKALNVYEKLSKKFRKILKQTK